MTRSGGGGHRNMVDGGWRAGWNPGFGGLVGIQVLGPGGNPGFGAWWESRFRAFGKPGLGAGGKHSGTHRIWPPCYSHVHLLQPTADVHAAAMCGPHWICGCTHPASLTLYPSQPASQPTFTKPLLHPPILPPTKSPNQHTRAPRPHPLLTPPSPPPHPPLTPPSLPLSPSPQPLP